MLLYFQGASLLETCLLNWDPARMGVTSKLKCRKERTVRYLLVLTPCLVLY